MSAPVDIRDSVPGDLAALEQLYSDAFPGEDLLPLVGELLRAHGVLSLVATIDGALAGHVLFTACGISGGDATVALLGPLAVARARQKQGIGRALVEAGLRRLERSGVSRVHVLGDPAYYGRLGFVPEAGVEPPYALPPAWRGAWQTMPLRPGGPPLRGTLAPPQPWLRPGLWAP